jgi:hypothetical protein
MMTYLPRTRVTCLILLVVLQWVCSATDLYSGFWMFWITLALDLWIALEIVDHYRRPAILRKIATSKGISLILAGLILTGCVSYKYTRVQYAKYQIYQWIHGTTFPELRDPDSYMKDQLYQWLSGKNFTESQPNQDGFPIMYLPSRPWCGNGIGYLYEGLYGGTAEREFRKADPAIRLRALRASIAMCVWDCPDLIGPLSGMTEKAMQDPDPKVRKLATDFMLRNIE